MPARRGGTDLDATVGTTTCGLFCCCHHGVDGTDRSLDFDPSVAFLALQSAPYDVIPPTHGSDLFLN